MIRKIKEIADVRIGYHFQKKINPTPEGIHQVIQIKDVAEGQMLNLDNIYNVTLKRPAERYLVKQGDILFLARGHKNFAVPVVVPLENTVAAGYFFILHPKENSVSAEYLAWYINQTPAQRYLQRQARRGTHMPIVGKSDFIDLPVNIPTLEAQKKIVAITKLANIENQLLNTLRQKRELLVNQICLQASKS